MGDFKTVERFFDYDEPVLYTVSNGTSDKQWIYLLSDGYFVTIVGILGIIGNILSILVLGQKHMRKVSMNVLLLGLQITDLIAVSALIIRRGIHRLQDPYNVSRGNTYSYAMLEFIAAPVGFTALLASRIFTLLVTIERYIAVCHPLRTSSWCSHKNAIIASFCALIFAIIFEIPSSLDLTIVSEEVNGEIKYRPALEGIIADTEFARIYFGWVQPIVSHLFPYTMLIILNMQIYLQVRKASTQRNVLRNSGEDSNSSHERSLIRLLFAIVITYIFCSFFQLFVLIGPSIFYPPSQPPEWVKWCIMPFEESALVLNSSCNFIFYCAFGTKFRMELGKLFGINKTSGEETRSLSEDYELSKVQPKTRE